MYEQYLASNLWLVVRYFPHFLAVYFGIMILFAKDFRTHSFVLFAYMILVIISFSEISQTLTIPEYYAEFAKQELCTGRIGICAIILLTSLTITDKKALCHCLLMCLMISVNYMLIYYLKEEPSSLSSFVYNFYDELIILIYLTQAFISRNGINRAHNGILLLLRADRDYHFRGIKVLRRSKETKEST